MKGNTNGISFSIERILKPTAGKRSYGRKSREKGKIFPINLEKKNLLQQNENNVLRNVPVMHYPVVAHPHRSPVQRISNVETKTAKYGQIQLQTYLWNCKNNKLMMDNLCIVNKQDGRKVRRVGHSYQSRAPPKHKPCRTTFTHTQVSRLENSFKTTKYLSTTERTCMAKDLGMTDTQIKTWYQNRRTKMKREIGELCQQHRLKERQAKMF